MLKRAASEALAGSTTFVAMVVVMAVLPDVLCGQALGTTTGFSADAVVWSTAIAVAIGSVLMGTIGRLPIAVGPTYGQAFFLVLTLIPAAAASGSPEPWKAAIGATLIAGTVLLLLSLLGLRTVVLRAVDAQLQTAIGCGIGLLIAAMGLRAAGIIAPGAGAFRLVLDLRSPDVIVCVIGIAVACMLQARGWRTGLLIATVVAFAGAWLLRSYAPTVFPQWAAMDAWTASQIQSATVPTQAIGLPVRRFDGFFSLDIAGAVAPQMWMPTLLLLFSMLSDSTTGLLALMHHGGFISSNDDPPVRRAMIADSLATCASSLLGVSACGAYAESNAGIASGGRTGLTAVVAGTLMLLALLCAPIVEALGNYPPASAPVLVLVGAAMASQLRRLQWSDPAASVPMLLVIVGIPLTSSIADSIAAALLVSPAMKLVAGRARETSPLAWLFAAAMLCYFIWLR
jgi:AGZA family xanthine/uracil permease-like MFS transporter